MTKRVELKIEDDALPELLTALGQIKGLDALKVEPVRIRIRKPKGETETPANG